jgi:group I intron endonuclease
MYYIVYQITNKVNNKIYIGAHKTDNLADGYMGSGKLIIRAIKKYDIDNFSKEILFIFDNADDMYKKERDLVTESFVEDSMTYNIKPGGRGGCATVMSDETRKLLSERSIGIKKTKEHTENIRRAKTGSKNPMYGVAPWNKNKPGYSTKKLGQKRKWITDGVQSKQTLREFPIPEGWRKGRIIRLRRAKMIPY